MRKSILFVLVMAIVLLAGVGLAAQDERVLVIGHTEQTDFYDPANGFTGTTSMVRRATYDTLVTFPDEDASEILPSLASSWSVSDDGLTYTFSLDEAPRFNNGDSVTADDVAFSLQRLKYVRGHPSFLADGIESAVANEDGTVTVTLLDVRPTFVTELANTAFSITNADVVRANGGTDGMDAAETDAAAEYLNQNSAGTGPYQLESWAPQDETVLVRNPHFVGEAPYFDRILIVNISEAATQKAALESGQIDIATDLNPDQIAELHDNPDVNVWSGPGQWNHFLIMNADPEIGGPVSDPKVWLAVRLALDYDGYRELWPGSSTPGTVMNIFLAGAFQQDRALSRDLERSKALLAEAGYPDGFDIDLKYPDWNAFGIDMNINAQKAQADLAEVGINVNLAPGEFGAALEEYRLGNAGFGYWLWGPDINDPVDVLAFVPGGKVATERLRFTEERAPAEILELRDAVKRESDAVRRAELFEQIQLWLQESGNFAPFLYPATQTALRNGIVGYNWHPQWVMDVALISRDEM
jgi:peptide/nickel transport system substrate-binding protein